jgi:hypothetical protein
MSLLPFLFGLRTPTRAPRHRPNLSTLRDGLILERLEDRTLLSIDLAVPGLDGFEPSIAVNPLNPRNVVVAQHNRLRISTDFGTTFPVPVDASLPAGADPMTQITYADPQNGYQANAGDDALAFDSLGRLFWVYLIRGRNKFDANFANIGFQLEDIHVVVAQVNPMDGTLIGTATDLSPGHGFNDKPWIAADASPNSPFANSVYVTWTLIRPDVIHPSDIFFASRRSELGWTTKPNPIFSGVSINWPSHVAVAPNGDVYVAEHFVGLGKQVFTVIFDLVTTLTTGIPTPIPPFLDFGDTGIELRRSGDGGLTFSDQTSAFAGGQAMIVPNVSLGSGFEALSAIVFGERIPKARFLATGSLAPYIVTDPVRPGNIYVITSNQPPTAGGVRDYADVVFARTTDFGGHWDYRTISHGPLGSLQVFPMATVDENGNLAVMWYDTRRRLLNASGNWLLDVFATVSRDGGLTFTDDFRVNDAPFDPDLGALPYQGLNDVLRIGEYIGLAASNGIAYAAWTGNAGAGQTIFFKNFSIVGAFPDRFEPNEAAISGLATDLGVASVYNENNLTIHSASDRDVFRFIARATGKMEFRVAYPSMLADVDFDVRDSLGTVIQTAPRIPPLTGSRDPSDFKRVSIPVIQGTTYFMRVFPTAGQQPPQNTYSLSVTNLDFIDLNQRFVLQLYRDLLGREADQSGLAAFSAALDRGATRGQVVLAIEASPEYRANVVQNFYGLFLYRPADPGGLNASDQFLATGGTDEQLEAVLTGSPEYFANLGGGTEDGFLSALYLGALGRPIDPSGRATYTQALHGGASRAQIAAAILGSSEYRQNLVQGFYLRFLHRPADSGGLNFYAGALHGGVSDEQAIAAIVGSDEYYQRL